MADQAILPHPDTAGNQSIPGDAGVWTFIFADMCAFAVFFLVFAAGRIGAPDLYEQSRRQLDPGLGLANTLILLTSGAFMAKAARYAKRGNRAATLRMLAATLGVGALFGLTKAIEWRAKFEHGIGLTTNEFFTYYFVFTGVHFLHFVIGLGVLLVLIARTRRLPLDGTQVRWIEAGGAYWHMVDLLWIVLFAMLYLLRRT